MTNSAPVDGYIKALCALAEEDRNLIVLDADNSKSTRTERFRAQHPAQFLDLGIAEQNLVGVAVGLANAGKTVFANTFAPFITGKCYDVVRVSAAYSQSNVKLVGCAGGIEMGEAGPTHLAPDDVGLMTLLPNMRVLVPASAEEAYEATLIMAQEPGPFYMRVSRRKARHFENGAPLRLGKARVLREGTDVALLSCGPILEEVMASALELSQQGISAAVVGFPTIKPLDEDTLLAVVQQTNAVVIVDEHTSMGGLTGLISTYLATHWPVSAEVVAVPDRFCPTMPFPQLAEKCGLYAANITAAALRVRARKQSGGMR